MYYAVLPQRGLLALSGADRIAFLQGLITTNATKLEKGEALYALLLSPQGKFQHDFFLIPSGDKILIDVDKSQVEELSKRLMMYKLRSDIALEKLPESHGVVVAFGEGPHTYPLTGKNLSIVQDPRLHTLGWRIIGDVATGSAWCEEREECSLAHADDYDRARLELGVPEGGRDMIPGKSFLMEFALDQLNGVDFSKGCYVGQEVTARSHYRGEVKKTLHQIKAKSGALPESGTPIYAGEMQVGELRSHNKELGLAILRLAELEKAKNESQPLNVDGIVIEAAIPAWAQKPESK